MNAFLSPRSFGWCCVLLALNQAPAAAPPQPPHPAEKEQQAIFRLNYVKASEAARILRQLFGGPMGASVSMAVDERLNALIVSAGPGKLEEAAAILTKIDTPRPGKIEPERPDVQVRLFWLVGGRLPKNVPGLPDELKALVAELGKGGLDKPRLGAQLSITTALEGKFESAGTVGLGASYELSVSGMAALKDDRVGVQLTVSVTQAAQRKTPSRRVASLRTQVTVLPGRPVVLAVTPSGALVLQVVGRKPQPPAKGFSFEMRNKPWKDVFTWLSEHSGKPVIANFKPTGSFTFVGPPKKTYSISEVIDIINEGLLAKSMTQKYYLIHGERSFTLVPADEKIDNAIVPRIDVSELDRRGRTEIVSVVIPLRSLKAEEVVPEIKKMLGPFGDVVALRNRLVLQDTAGNLRRIYQTIQDIEKPKGK